MLTGNNFGDCQPLCVGHYYAQLIFMCRKTKQLFYNIATTICAFLIDLCEEIIFANFKLKFDRNKDL